MIPNRALRALQPLSREHTRYISSTTSRCAEESSASRISARKERSALISNEVAALQRGPPTQASTPSPPTPSAGALETPPSTDAPGRTGQNTPASREGIAAQGIARLDNVKKSAGGGADVLSTSAPGKAEIAVRPSRGKRLKVTAAGRAYSPTGFTKKELLGSGEGTATIAGGNFAGVVEDRFHHVFSPGQRAGQVLSKVQVMEKAEQGQVSRVLGKAEVGARGHLLEKEVRDAVVGKLVKGEFDRKGLLSGKKEGKRPNTVEEVKRGLLRNGTYLGRDATKLTEKVQGFLTKEQWKKLQNAPA